MTEPIALRANGTSRSIEIDDPDMPLLYALHGETSGPFSRTPAWGRAGQPPGLELPRVTVAHDCSLVVNPDGLRDCIEGNIAQGASRSL
jgi:hypothetical protein